MGQAFDWSILGGRAPHATFIAGGVTPENVSALLRQQPWGVDLSSGVESVPGVKDPIKLGRLFAALGDDAFLYFDEIAHFYIIGKLCPRPES